MQTLPFTLRDLEMLVVIHQTGSLKKAAEQLTCTPSALSHRMRELESRLDQTLIERGRPARLTPQAQNLVARAEPILHLTVQLAQDLTPHTEIRRIGISSLLLAEPHLDAVTRFVERGPTEYSIQTGRSSDIDDGVAQGLVDVGLVRLERARPDLYYQVILEDRLVVAGPKAATWNRAPWVLFSNRMGHGKAVNQALADAGIMIKPKVITDSFTVALRLVQDGWISVFPWSLVGPLIAPGQLVEIQIPNVLWPFRRTAVVTRPSPPTWLPLFIAELKRPRPI